MKTKFQRVSSAFPVILSAVCIMLGTTASGQQSGNSPVKVYIMIGQSNMEGQGEMVVGMDGNPNPDPAYTASTPGTLEYIVDDTNDPTGNYDFLVDGSGDWVVRDDVWIYFNNGRRILNDPGFPINGDLQPGFGPVSPDTIGPELGFGHKMGDLHGQQVLLIKTAWGGRSLSNDFLPPSSRIGLPEPVEAGDPGYDYERAVNLVSDATKNLTIYFPDYNGQGYEIAGICWHQGWNDKDRTSLAYRADLANLIRDLRSEFGVPNCPFVVATSGMGAYKGIEYAQLSVADASIYPEFDGNVSVIDTRNETYLGYTYEQPSEGSPKAEGFHWNRNARTYLHMGMAMGDAMAALPSPRCPSRLGVISSGASSDVTLSWQNGSETPTSVRILRNGTEIAAAAPVSPASYVDSSLAPGTYEYELQFTMPGDPCDPLTLTVNTGITGLTVTGSGPTVTLEWDNNLTYAGIEIRRNGNLIEASLAGATTTYTDASALGNVVNVYTVQPTNGSSDPAQVSVGSNLDTSGDSTPPTPSTMTWSAPPVAVSSSAITMTATTANDENGVEYYFTSTSGGGNDSGWQTSSTYTDTGLDSATLYGYKVQARDLSVNFNTNTLSSPEATATTLVAGVVTIADSYSFANDYFSGDGGGDDNGGASKPFTVSPTGFTSVGTDKLVGVITLHNSSASVAKLTSMTYGGVDLMPRVFVGNADGSTFSRSFMFYVDNPVADGDLVLDFAPDNNVDEVGIALFALNGTADGVESASQSLNPRYASAGDFIVGAAQKNNGGMNVANNPPFTEINLNIGNLKAAVGHLVATSSEDTAPTFTDNIVSSSFAIFQAQTTPSDTTAPTLDSADILDDRGGAAVDAEFVTYTITFSEDMDAATVNAGDFSNAGTSSVTIGSISEITPGVFSVGVTPTSVGALQLQVSAGASLTDAAGNALDTTSAIVDDTTITVNSVNRVPVFSSNPIAGPDATEDSAYGGTLSGSATDDDDDPLTYAKVSGPAWLDVAGNGALSGTPANGDVGANSFTVSVTDGNIASPVQATLNITVVNTNDGPVFSSNPIIGGDVAEDSAYTGTLSGSATDDDDNPLTYAKVSGPVWLNVAGNGTLSGTPGSGDVGLNSFTVSVTDNIVASPVEATLNIRVDAAPTGLVTITDSHFSGGDSANTVDPSNASITVDTTGFSSDGADKLVVTVDWHNSARKTPSLLGVTYNGVPMSAVINYDWNPQGGGGGFSGGSVWYLDNVSSDGDLVFTFDNSISDAGTDDYQVDEWAVSIFALTGSAAGFTDSSVDNSSTGTPVTVASGGFIIGAHHRNNNSTELTAASVAAGYLGSANNNRYGNLTSAIGHQVVGSGGSTAPAFTSDTSTSFTYVASFDAEATPESSAYDTWAATNAPTTGGDLSADEDGDGVANGIEFLVGGTSSTNDHNKLPVVSEDGSNMNFTFARSQESIDPSLSVVIEVGTDLSTWPDFYPLPGNATPGPPVSVVKDSSPGYDTVTLSVPMAPDARKFARLKVSGSL